MLTKYFKTNVNGRAIVLLVVLAAVAIVSIASDFASRRKTALQEARIVEMIKTPAGLQTAALGRNFTYEARTDILGVMSHTGSWMRTTVLAVSSQPLGPTDVISARITAQNGTARLLFYFDHGYCTQVDEWP